MSRQTIQYVLAVACLLGLSSCSTPQTTKTLAEYGIPAYKSGVVGAFSVGDVVNTGSTSSKQGRLDVFIRHESTGETYKIAFEKGGRSAPFFVMLPPGTYRFVRGQIAGAPPGAATYNWTGPDAQFEVSSDEISCVGTLQFKSEGDMESLPMQATLGNNVPGEWNVSDTCNQLTSAVRKMYPKLGRADMSTKLAKLEGARSRDEMTASSDEKSDSTSSVSETSSESMNSDSSSSESDASNNDSDPDSESSDSSPSDESESDSSPSDSSDLDSTLSNE